MQGGRADIRRSSPVAFLVLTERIVREARTAQAAGIGDAIVRAFAAAVCGARVPSSLFHDALGLRDTLMPARQRSRTCHPHRERDAAASNTPAAA
jgi:hypothetical protein